MDCYTRARQETGLDEHEIITLCRCATSTRSVECFLEAKRTTTLDDPEILKLCVGTAVYPADCYPFYYR